MPPEKGADAAGKLRRVAEIGHLLGAARLAEEAASLAERLEEGRFYVACVGQFKRGKSTLLNALVGDAVLPMGVAPVTTVPTVLRYGQMRRTRIRFYGGTWTDIDGSDLEQYVSEEHNPENAKGVAGAEVFLPSALLAGGMSLIDTPGLGSVFAGNTAATQELVPHIDAAIIVVGADPPIAGDELVLVERIGKQVRHMFVVLNKADRVSDSDRQIAAPFTQRVLEKRLGRPVGPIYQVSAIRPLENQKAGWDWDAFVLELRKLAQESGGGMVRAAWERGLRRLAEELLAIALQERGALVRPIEESERRIAVLRKTILDAERSLRELSYLLMGEQHRLSDIFLAQRKFFLAATSPRAKEELERELRNLPRHFGPRFRRAAMQAAQETAERYVLPWLEAEQPRAEENYKNVAGRFVNLGNDFVKKLSESQIPELARMPNATNFETGFRVASHFTFEGLIHVAQPTSPLRYLGDTLLGLVGAFSLIEKESQRFFDHLLVINSMRVQSDVVDRVQESRGRLEAEIRKLLHEVSHIAERALEHARDASARGTTAVEERLAQLHASIAELRLLVGS
ncbi:MAG: dynamin family protein [Candidatus Acidiferrum sp.]